MVFQSMMWCSSGRRRVAIRLVTLVSRWKQFFRRKLTRGDIAMHDRQIVPVGPAQATNDPIDVPPSIYEQGTQICKAVVPVPAQSVLAPSSPLIVVRNLKKAYARRLAVNDVSSCVERGEFVIVTGPVGAGKSTLLHILAGMVRPSRGDYWLAECNIKHLSLDKLAMLRNQQLGFIG